MKVALKSLTFDAGALQNIIQLRSLRKLGFSQLWVCRPPPPPPKVADHKIHWEYVSEHFKTKKKIYKGNFLQRKKKFTKEIFFSSKFFFRRFFFLAMLFRFVAGFARVRIEDSRLTGSRSTACYSLQATLFWFVKMETSLWTFCNQHFFSKNHFFEWLATFGGGSYIFNMHFRRKC